MKKYIPIAVVILLITGVIFVVTQYIDTKEMQQAQNQKRAEQQKSFGSEVASTPAQTNVHSFLGSISNLTDEGFVIKNVDGKTAVFTFSEKTEYIGGEKSDLAVGKDVSGYGLKDSAGKIIVEKIQVNPKRFMKRDD